MSDAFFKGWRPRNNPLQLRIKSIYLIYFLSYVKNNGDLFFSVFTLQKRTALTHITNSWLNSIRQKFFSPSECLQEVNIKLFSLANNLDALEHRKFHIWWMLKNKKVEVPWRCQISLVLGRRQAVVFFRIPTLDLNAQVLPHLHFDPSVLFLNLTLAPTVAKVLVNNLSATVHLIACCSWQC